MKTSARNTLRPAAGLATLLLAAMCGSASANDFPTLDRVLYVQECMRENPGQYYETVSKCACALDALAAEVSYEAYTNMHTSALAISIGGERGSYIRSNDSERAEIKRFKDLQARVYKGCFLGKVAAQ